MPKLSVITINLNNLAGLQKTMESVFAQTFTDYEYVIIDGGSSDGSKEYLEQHAGKLSYQVSERDKGIYNAMNKGILQAKGEYVLFLNSGDYLFNENVLAQFSEKGNNTDIIYGDVVVEKGTHKIEWKLPEKLMFSFFLSNSLPHLCSFIKRSLFEEIGLYTETYKIVSDWEFFLLAIHKFQCSNEHINIPVAVFNMEGISNQPENQQLIIEERKTVLQKHFASLLPDYEQYEKLKNELERIKKIPVYRVFNKLNKIFTRS